MNLKKKIEAFFILGFLGTCALSLLFGMATLISVAPERKKARVFNSHLAQIKKEAGVDSPCIKTKYKTLP